MEGKENKMFVNNHPSGKKDNTGAERNQRPMRDSKGRFVKGHKPLVRPKYKRMKENPKLICKTCYKKNVCPEYHPDFVCLYKREFKKYKTRKIDEVMEKLGAESNETHADLQFAHIQEMVSGEFLPKTSRLLGRLMNQLFLLCYLHMQIDRENTMRLIAESFFPTSKK